MFRTYICVSRYAHDVSGNAAAVFLKARRRQRRRQATRGTAVITYERRKHPRRKLRRAVQVLTVIEARPPLDCMLIDISQSGARLDVPSAAELPSEFLLVLSEDVQRWCRVVRRTERDIGVKFIQTRRAQVALIG